MQNDEMNENEVNSNDHTTNEPKQENPNNVPEPVSTWQESRLNLVKVQTATERIKEELGKVIVGQQALIELLIATVFSRGHALLEGVPGIAKTLTAKLMAKTMDVGFSRIQFTPDLMPE